MCSLVIKRFIPTQLIFYPCYLLATYVLYKLYGNDLIANISKDIVILAAISIIGWLFLLIDAKLLASILQPFNFSGGFREEYGFFDYIHIGIYTVHDLTIETIYTFLPRNAGFCWEPGIFSVFLVLALFIRTSLLKKHLSSFSSIILVIALLTTQSTTGYIAFFIYLIYYYSSKIITLNLRYTIPLIIIVIIGVYSFINLEFMQSKVDFYIETGSHFGAYGTTPILTGSRLSGLPLVWQDLKRNPIMGKALSSVGTYSGIGEIYSTHLNSIFSIISSMGLFGFWVWLLFLIKSTHYYCYIYHCKDILSFPLIIITTSFGFNIHSQLIIFTMMSIGLFANTPKYINSNYQSKNMLYLKYIHN
ncbi:MAG: hypothetical protein BWX61_00176 [Bacteroidetes bacterium ADurb.Bin035]|nr:MAG: hypothetical protein BWX61_00176 [Bacteroidetes bacterium ADurb.Bin035]